MATKRSGKLLSLARKVLLYGITGLFAVLALFRVSAALRETEEASTIAPSEGVFLATQAGTLYVQSVGPEDGQPLILIHGTAAWSGLWMPTAQVLARAGYQVHALDLPPFGFSDRSPEMDFGRKAQAARIIAALESLNTKDAIIVAHSFGGGPAVEAIMQQPSLFRGSVLIDVALGLDQAQDARLPMLLRPTMARETAMAATATNPLATGMLFRTLVYRKDSVGPDQVAVIQKPMAQNGTTEAFAAWLPSLFEPGENAMSTDKSNYRSLSLPTVILWGDKDTVTPLEQGQQLTNLLPNASLITLKSVGHIPQIEDPELLEAELLAALTAILNQPASARQED